ncbi:MAG: hypothetical protein ACJ79R_04415 [Anaeromyxobacteraceae bacterium]
MENPLITQCAAVLLDRVPTLEEVERAIGAHWNIAADQSAAQGDGGWAMCGRGFVVELRSGRAAIVDIMEEPWPDDPRSAPEAVRAAWQGGYFGPSSAPGALARAKKQAWAWEEGVAAADRHRAAVRIRTVITFPEGAPRELPKDHDPIHELTTVTELAGALLKLGGAMALFMPGGEVLRSRQHVEEVLHRKTGLGPPPVDLWVNLRAVGLGEDAGVRWLLLDAVGMKQLRLPDQEAVLADGQEEPDAVATLLTNACIHLASGKAIPPGSTSDDGRGRRWRASMATGVLAPPGRTVVRWTPEQSANLGDAELAALLARQMPAAAR